MERIVLILYSNYFGHQARHWNPKMARYIYGKRNGIHIIDLIQTYFQLKKVLKFLTDSASQGKTFLFVGTKKQAAPVISKIAIECNSFYVNQRWLGGMLTNWQTVKSSIKKLNELELREKTSSFQNLPKKEIALAKKQKERLEKYIGGLKEMKSLPDVVILIGQPAEKNAVHECTKLGIRSITILCDKGVKTQ
uniref:Small ribosomal subunit protein uS2c n=1 Tax=Neomeris sp. HV02668 TaxID=1979229 RepID=A0A1W5YJS5_9CHLO|nr:ribosomal protein S2 [Neomeris sp. HV02668]